MCTFWYSNIELSVSKDRSGQCIHYRTVVLWLLLHCFFSFWFLALSWACKQSICITCLSCNARNCGTCALCAACCCLCFLCCSATWFLKSCNFAWWTWLVLTPPCSIACNCSNWAACCTLCCSSTFWEAFSSFWIAVTCCCSFTIRCWERSLSRWCDLRAGCRRHLWCGVGVQGDLGVNTV